MDTKNLVASTGSWLLENGHRLVLALTGGRFPRRLMGMTTVELHTVGRKSGKPYSNLLTSPVHDADRFVLVASKGGHENNPDWYTNAVATPDVTLDVDGESVPVHARAATAEERAELWPQITEKYKGYAEYQRNTDREIPLLICQRR